MNLKKTPYYYKMYLKTKSLRIEFDYIKAVSEVDIFRTLLSAYF